MSPLSFLDNALIRILLLLWLAGTSLALFSPAVRVRQVRDEVRTALGAGRADHAAPSRSTWEDEDTWHGGLFLGLGILLIAQWPRPRRRSRIVPACVALTAFSIASEVIQERFVPGRAFEWNDLFVNQLGLVAGLALGFAGVSRRCPDRDPLLPSPVSPASPPEVRHAPPTA